MPQCHLDIDTLKIFNIYINRKIFNLELQRVEFIDVYNNHTMYIFHTTNGDYVPKSISMDIPCMVILVTKIDYLQHECSSPWIIDVLLSVIKTPNQPHIEGMYEDKNVNIMT